MSLKNRPFNADKMVSHPDHYQSETGLEVIDVIEAFTFDLNGIEATDTGNILKYMCRWSKKNGLQDLNKAKWYLEHLIAHVEKMTKENEKPKADAVAEQRVRDTIFTSRVDAETVLEHMREILKEYGCVSISDLYDLIGLGGSFGDRKYGWFDLEGSNVVRVRDGYKLVLPVEQQLVENKNDEGE